MRPIHRCADGELITTRHLPEVTELGADREETKGAISCGPCPATCPWPLGQPSDPLQLLGPPLNHRRHSGQRLQSTGFHALGCHWKCSLVQECGLLREGSRLRPGS